MSQSVCGGQNKFQEPNLFLPLGFWGLSGLAGSALHWAKLPVMHSNFKSDINSYIYLTWNNYPDNVLIFASNSFQILPNFKYGNDNSPYDKANTKDEIILEVVENESQISFMCIFVKINSPFKFTWCFFNQRNASICARSYSFSSHKIINFW